MQKAVLYGIIAAVVIAGGVGIGVAIWSMNSGSTEPAVASSQSSDDNDVRVIKHAMGETEIVGTPKRVVVIGTTYVEPFLAFGIEPVGLNSKDIVDNWYPEVSNWTNTAEIGAGGEPNLEVISQLEPDLIIASDVFVTEIYDDLTEIAPTIVTNTFPLEGGAAPLEQNVQDFMRIADALNRHDEGVAVIEKMQAKFDEAESKIEAAGLKDSKFIMAGAYIFDAGPQLRLQLPNSVTSNILEEIGMKNAVPPEKEFNRFGEIRPSLEALATLDDQDVHFIYMHEAAGDPFSESEYWQNHPVWTTLEFVKEGNVYPINVVFLYGGPLKAQEFADEVVNALTVKPQQSDETRTISHAMGETEITGTPERVVILDAQSFSILMELGIQPVGVQTWERWFFDHDIFWEEYYPGISQQWPDVVNVGRGEPNFETIAQLEPDLIIAPIWGGEIYDDLSAIAPTILFTGAAPEGSGLNLLEAAERNTMGIADALNRHDEGVAMIERFHAKLDEAESKLEAAGIKGEKFIFSQLISQQDSSFNVRVWDDTSKPSLILEGMGLVNAASAPEGITPTADGRLENVGLEGLSTMDGPDVHFIYMPTGDNPITTVWQDNPVWNNLSFVKEGRVYSLESNLYMFGGPQKDAEFVDRVVEVLTTSSNN